jgi:hypothetical protein
MILIPSRSTPDARKGHERLVLALAAREHLPLRLSVAYSAIDHPPLGHLLLLLVLASEAVVVVVVVVVVPTVAVLAAA